MTQVKDVGERIGDLPLLGKRWLEIEVFVAAHQGVKDQFVDAFRLRIETHPGVEVGRAALDDHDQRVAVGPRV